MPNVYRTTNRLCVIGESDPFLARLLQRFGEKSGLRIQLARTGEEVLELVKQETPELMILDPELPGKVRGWEAVQSLRAGDQSCHILIIICSWLKKPEAMALVGQVFAYLQKPDLRYEDFTAALNEAGVNFTPDKSNRTL